MEMAYKIRRLAYSSNIAYRIHVIWAQLLNRTPPNEYSNTTPVKNPVLPQKLAKNGKIAAKFELKPTQKPILRNKTLGFK